MTPQTSTATHLTLDPATTDATLATIFGALRLDPARTPAQLQTQRDAGAALIAALRPRNPVEAAYAARAAAAHYGSMECFRRTMHPDTPDSVGLRWSGKAVALSRMATEMTRALRECQAATPGAQPQPAARPAMPPIPTPAAAQATIAVGRQDPMPSERRSPAPPAFPFTARPAVPPMPTPAAAARPAVAMAAKPAAAQAPIAVGRQDPMPSERRAPAPVAFPFTAGPAAAPPLLAAPPPRPGLRAGLLGSTSLASGVVPTPPVQPSKPAGS